MTVTPAVTPQKRHQTGKVTLATVEAALATLGVNASMRAVQRVTGGSFRDVCAVVNLVRGRASVTVQEALAAGDPKDFGHTLVETLRAIERSISETRDIQARQDEQLAALQRAAEGYRTRRHDDRLLDALDQLHLDLAAIRPDLTKAAAKTASKDPMAMRSLLAGLEARLLEAIAESRGATAAPAELPAPVPLTDPDLLLHLQAAHAGMLSSLTQIHADQRELASAVSALHRDLVERHAHHAQRLSDSDAAHQRELAHIHRHLRAVRTDLAAVQDGIGAATAQLVQTQRTQTTALRRTLRELALAHLQSTAIAGAAFGRGVAIAHRRVVVASRKKPPSTRIRVRKATPTSISRPAPQRPRPQKRLSTAKRSRTRAAPVSARRAVAPPAKHRASPPARTKGRGRSR